MQHRLNLGQQHKFGGGGCQGIHLSRERGEGPHRIHRRQGLGGVLRESGERGRERESCLLHCRFKQEVKVEMMHTGLQQPTQHMRGVSQLLGVDF